MMRYFIIIQLLLPVVLYSQNNLVPNSGFELFNTCPNNLGQIDKAIPWFQPYTGLSSTDFYNHCSVSTPNSIPVNYLGNQGALNGDGYAGFQSWSQTFNIREYLEVELTDTLIQGQLYCVSFWVSIPESFKYGSDGIGAYFSANPVFYSTPFYGVLPLIPQIENTIGNIITDTSNWVLINGSFVAQGGEKYLTIGNFRNDIQTNTTQIQSLGASQSYFYIDDVSVIQGSCNVGVMENNHNTEKTIAYPNPTTGLIEFKEIDDASIEVFESSGRKVMSLRSQNKINLGQFENGIYLIRITRSTGNVIYKNVVLDK